jgi:hypothetical protein
MSEIDDIRAEAIRSRAFIRGAETQLSKVIALIDDAPVGPPPDPVDPPVVDPDPPTTTEGFLARQPRPDAIRVPGGGDLASAIATGKDVLLQADATYRLGNRVDLRDGQLIDVYGEGDRPVVICTRAFGIDGVSNVQIVGLHLYCEVGNPWSPAYDFKSDRSNAISVTDGASNVLIEDCLIDFFEKGIVAVDEANAQTRDILVHRCIIRYNWNKGDRGAGIYTNRVRDFAVTESVIDHNGWHPLIDNYRRGVQAHGCYFSGRYNSGVPDKWPAADNDPSFVIEFHRNIVSRSSANGCQFRLGGNVTDCVFVGNPMGLYTWTNDSTVRRTAILDGTHIPGRERGWGIQIIAGGEYSDLLIANVTRATASSHAIVYEHPNAILDDIRIYNWKAEQRDSGVYDKNNVNPDVSGVTETHGGDRDATLTDDEIEFHADRPRGVWGEQYDAGKISERLREAYP